MDLWRQGRAALGVEFSKDVRDRFDMVNRLLERMQKRHRCWVKRFVIDEVLEFSTLYGRGRQMGVVTSSAIDHHDNLAVSHLGFGNKTPAGNARS